MPRQETSPAWKHEPEEHDFPAAQAYLTLLMSEHDARTWIGLLRQAPVVTRKAKDILRSSGLPLLPRHNPHVAADLEKIAAGEKLSPCLVLRGAGGNPAVVADGYHRVCASYWTDENCDVPIVLAG
jgi:hypothetical protein